MGDDAVAPPPAGLDSLPDALLARMVLLLPPHSQAAGEGILLGWQHGCSAFEIVTGR
jgi:hypothetical protein